MTVAARTFPRLDVAAIVILGFLVLLTLPLYICLPPYSDNDFYGLAATIVRRGGVLERDMRSFYFPPGFVWLRLGIDGLSGGRHEALKAADLLIAMASITLLVRWPRPRIARPRRWAMAIALMLFYLSTPEVCHVQPDVWMLLPTLVGLHLRRRQLERHWNGDAQSLPVAAAAYAEGLMCGVACLLKPQAIVPMLAIWTTSILLVLVRQRRCTKQLVVDATSLLIGGATCAAAWIAWLAIGGGWNSFVETYHWASGYYATAPSRFMRMLSALSMFLPWSMIHLAAIPWAAIVLIRRLRARARGENAAANDDSLFVAFYLGWTFQATFLQVAWMYHVLPPVLLAMTLLLQRLAVLERRGGPAVAVVAGLVAILDPMLMPGKLVTLPRCWSEGSSPAVRDALANIPYYPPHIAEFLDPARIVRAAGVKHDLATAQAHARIYVVEWENMERVAQFLSEQRVGDGELVCYHNTTLHLFLRLGVLPATRDVAHDLIVSRFPIREDELRRELAASRARFVVSDLQRGTLDDPPPPDPLNPLAIPTNFPDAWRDRYPWSQPIVFRAGRYAVHQVTGRVEPLTGLVP